MILQTITQSSIERCLLNERRRRYVALAHFSRLKVQRRYSCIVINTTLRIRQVLAFIKTLDIQEDAKMNFGPTHEIISIAYMTIQGSVAITHSQSHHSLHCSQNASDSDQTVTSISTSWMSKGI